MFDRLYDVMEPSQVNFIGYVSERARYDFAIVYTSHFFGKPLVICMQTGRSSLLCYDDLSNIDYLQQIYNIREREEAEELSIFLQHRLHTVSHSEQY